MSLASGPLSVEQYLAMADTLPRFTQLIGGEIVVSEPTRLHQHVLGEIYHRLRLWADAEPGRGYPGLPVNVILGERNVYAPDVWWMRQAPDIQEPNLIGPPDLAVEVRSPSTWRYDVHVKKATYEQHGLAELWLVDTKERRVLVFRRSSPEEQAFDLGLEVGAEETLTSPLLPGFTLDLGALFLV